MKCGYERDPTIRLVCLFFHSFPFYEKHDYVILIYGAVLHYPVLLISTTETPP